MAEIDIEDPPTALTKYEPFGNIRASQIELSTHYGEADAKKLAYVQYEHFAIKLNTFSLKQVDNEIPALHDNQLAKKKIDISKRNYETYRKYAVNNEKRLQKSRKQKAARDNNEFWNDVGSVIVKGAEVAGQVAQEYVRQQNGYTSPSSSSGGNESSDIVEWARNHREKTNREIKEINDHFDKVRADITEEDRKKAAQKEHQRVAAQERMNTAENERQRVAAQERKKADLQERQRVVSSDNGCWSGNHDGKSCLTWSTYTKDSKAYFSLTNLCGSRLYVGWCAANKCGADGLLAGKTETKYEYTTSLDRGVWAVGSEKPSQDWNCKKFAGR
jgi:hypothetical protein